MVRTCAVTSTSNDSSGLVLGPITTAPSEVVVGWLFHVSVASSQALVTRLIVVALEPLSVDSANRESFDVPTPVRVRIAVATGAPAGTDEKSKSRYPCWTPGEPLQVQADAPTSM